MEAGMAQDKTNVRKHDAARIDTSQDQEVRYWAKKFGVTPAGLRAAVTAVGSNARDVEQHLQPIDTVIDPYF
jgi:hypothetical protein